MNFIQRNCLKAGTCNSVTVYIFDIVTLLGVDSEMIAKVLENAK